MKLVKFANLHDLKGDMEQGDVEHKFPEKTI
jgi:hypothetical protein